MSKLIIIMISCDMEQYVHKNNKSQCIIVENEMILIFVIFTVLTVEKFRIHNENLNSGIQNSGLCSPVN